VYFSYHPDAIVGRAGQVSIFNPDLQVGGSWQRTLMWSLGETIRSFFSGAGDTNWRHNVAGYPLLNPLAGFLAIVGAGYLLWQGAGVVGWWWMRRGVTLQDTAAWYIWLVLLAMLLPVITTAEGIPHGLRSVGLIVPLFVMIGVGGAFIGRWLMRRLPWALASVAGGVMAGLLIVSMSYDGALYFLIARNDPDAHAAYRADLPVVADFIRRFRFEHPDGPRPYLVVDTFSVQTIHYLTSVAPHDYQDHPDEAQHAYVQLDPATSGETHFVPGDVVIFTQSTLPDADRLARDWTASDEYSFVVVAEEFNRFGQEVMRVYRIEEHTESNEGSLDA
jgi:hypothetical protein